MKQFGWMLAAVYVGLAVGLFYSLAVDATDAFVVLAALLIGLALPPWYFLSRRREDPRDGASTSGDRP